MSVIPRTKPPRDYEFAAAAVVLFLLILTIPGWVGLADGESFFRAIYDTWTSVLVAR